jgi:transposase
MVGHGEKFSHKKEQAIAALLTEPSIESAAKSIGIGTQTLYRWLKVPEFQKSYREARREVFLQSIARLQQASKTAVSTLLDTMGDPNAPSSVKVRAAETVLNQARQGMELEDVESRISALEQAAEGPAQEQ